MKSSLQIPEQLTYTDKNGEQATIEIADVVIGHFKDHDREYRIAISKSQGLRWLSKKCLVYNPDTLETFFGGPHHAVCPGVLNDGSKVYIAASGRKHKSRVAIINREGNVKMFEPDDIRDWRIDEFRKLGKSSSDFLFYAWNLDYFYGLHLYEKYGLSFSAHGLE